MAKIRQMKARTLLLLSWRAPCAVVRTCGIGRSAEGSRLRCLGGIGQLTAGSRFAVTDSAPSVTRELVLFPSHVRALGELASSHERCYLHYIDAAKSQRRVRLPVARAS